MAFGFAGNGGEYIPRIKWNAKAGRAFRIERQQNAYGNWESAEHDITDHFNFFPDFAHLQRGWWNRVTYQDKMALMTEPMPERPAEVDAQGKQIWVPQVRFNLVLGKAAGGGLRSWSITAQSVMASVEAIYNTWKTSPQAKDESLVPAVAKTGIKAEKTKQGTNYVPEFNIAKFVPRPDDLRAPVPAADDDADPADAPLGMPAAASHDDDFDVTAAAAAAPGNGVPVTVGADDDSTLPF